VIREWRQPPGGCAAMPGICTRYKALMQEAIDRQVFDAPAYIDRDEPFRG
jgi:hypothetical protein